MSRCLSALESTADRTTQNAAAARYPPHFRVIARAGGLAGERALNRRALRANAPPKQITNLGRRGPAMTGSLDHG